MDDVEREVEIEVPADFEEVPLSAVVDRMEEADADDESEPWEDGDDVGDDPPEDVVSKLDGEAPVAGSVVELFLATSVADLPQVPAKSVELMRQHKLLTVDDVINAYLGWVGEPNDGGPLVVQVGLGPWQAGEVTTGIRTLATHTHHLNPVDLLPWLWGKVETEVDPDAQAVGEAVEPDPEPIEWEHPEPVAPIEVPADEPMDIPRTEDDPAGEPVDVVDENESATTEGLPADPLPQLSDTNTLGGWRYWSIPQFQNSFVRMSVEASGAQTCGELDRVVREGRLPHNLDQWQMAEVFTTLEQIAEGDPAFVRYVRPWEEQAERQKQISAAREKYQAESWRMSKPYREAIEDAKEEHTRLHTKASAAKKEVDIKEQELKDFMTKRDAEEDDYVRSRPQLFPIVAPPMRVNEGAEQKDRHASADLAAERYAEPAAPLPPKDVRNQLIMMYPLEYERWSRYGATEKQIQSLNDGVCKGGGEPCPCLVYGDIANKLIQPWRVLKDLKGWGDKGVAAWEEVENKFLADTERVVSEMAELLRQREFDRQEAERKLVEAVLGPPPEDQPLTESPVNETEVKEPTTETADGQSATPGPDVGAGDGPAGDHHDHTEAGAGRAEPPAAAEPAPVPAERAGKKPTTRTRPSKPAKAPKPAAKKPGNASKPNPAWKAHREKQSAGKAKPKPAAKAGGGKKAAKKRK